MTRNKSMRRIRLECRTSCGQTEENCSTKVIEFPVKAPVKELRVMLAIEQLELQVLHGELCSTQCEHYRPC